MDFSFRSLLFTWIMGPIMEILLFFGGFVLLFKKCHLTKSPLAWLRLDLPTRLYLRPLPITMYDLNQKLESCDIFRWLFLTRQHTIVCLSIKYFNGSNGSIFKNVALPMAWSSFFFKPELIFTIEWSIHRWAWWRREGDIIHRNHNLYLLMIYFLILTDLFPNSNSREAPLHG